MRQQTSFFVNGCFISTSSVVSMLAQDVILLFPSWSLYWNEITFGNTVALSLTFSSYTSAAVRSYLITSTLFCFVTVMSCLFIHNLHIAYYYLILNLNSSSPSLITESCVKISSTPSSIILSLTYVWFVDLLSFM